MDGHQRLALIGSSSSCAQREETFALHLEVGTLGKASCSDCSSYSSGCRMSYPAAFECKVRPTFTAFRSAPSVPVKRHRLVKNFVAQAFLKYLS